MESPEVAGLIVSACAAGSLTVSTGALTLLLEQAGGVSMVFDPRIGTWLP